VVMPLVNRDRRVGSRRYTHGARANGGLHICLCEALGPSLDFPTGRTLQRISDQLQQTRRPDLALLGVTAATITGRLTDGRHQLADAGRWLIEHVRDRLDFTTAHTLATATLHTSERLAGAAPDNPQYQRGVAAALAQVGDLLSVRGEVGAALEHYSRALRINEGWLRWTRTTRTISAAWRSPSAWWGISGPGGVRWVRRWSTTPERCAPSSGWPARTPTTRSIRATWLTLNKLGYLLAGRGEVGAALEHYTRALHIAERLAGADRPPRLSARCGGHPRAGGDLRAERGEVGAALEHQTRALAKDTDRCVHQPLEVGKEQERKFPPDEVERGDPGQGRRG
jgi:tetratricopeptide (TPR) repeat protein